MFVCCCRSQWLSRASAAALYPILMWTLGGRRTQGTFASRAMWAHWWWRSKTPSCAYSSTPWASSVTCWYAFETRPLRISWRAELGCGCWSSIPLPSTAQYAGGSCTAASNVQHCGHPRRVQTPAHSLSHRGTHHPGRTETLLRGCIASPSTVVKRRRASHARHMSLPSQVWVEPLTTSPPPACPSS